MKKKKNNVKPTPPRCPFSNKRLRLVLDFLNCGLQEEKRRGAGRN